VAKCSLDEFNNKFVTAKKRQGYKIRYVDEHLIKIEDCTCKDKKEIEKENLLF
jgi:hypothetical protein